jgi:hypothetical protein
MIAATGIAAAGMGAAGCFALGLLAGALHFGSLRWNTVFYARPGRLWTAMGLQSARIAGLGGVLFATSLHGALPLLLTALGILVARPLVTRWVAAAP